MATGTTAEIQLGQEAVSDASNPSNPITGFTGNAIKDSEATTISVENGIVTKTQVFDATATDEPVEAQDTASQQADANLGFVYDPVTGEMIPGDSSLAEELSAVDPDDDPNVRAMMEASRQEAEDNYVFSDAPTEADVDITDVQAPNPPSSQAPKDWRVRISLAPGAKYFYGDSSNKLLAPLQATGGVVFPYTPTISVSYNAKYDTQTLTHTNYAAHTYAGSSVDGVSITAEFTAQDVNEANYMLAVIHFFRSATKMFYGNDQTPARGTPPPLLYLSGYGQYQFDNHPMVLTNFTYSSPVDVDYINAYPGGTTETVFGVTLAPYLKPTPPKPTPMQSGLDRLLGSGLKPGATAPPPVFANPPKDLITRVPTRISISLSFLPIVTRRAVVNGFSLEKYANGSLLQGSKNPQNGGGLW